MNIQKVEGLMVILSTFYGAALKNPKISSDTDVQID